jgi:hypothetical protein
MFSEQPHQALQHNSKDLKTNINCRIVKNMLDWKGVPGTAEYI